MPDAASGLAASIAPEPGGWSVQLPNAAGLAGIDRLELVLPSDPALAGGTLQLAVLADHRGTFIWESRLTTGRTRFAIPLQDGAGWRAVDHAATWSRWELAALRTISVKLFGPDGRSISKIGRLAGTWVPAVSTPVSLAWQSPDPPTLKLGERWQYRFSLAGDQVDPWSPLNAGLRLEWIEPGKPAITLSPFLFQDFRTEQRVSGEVLVAQGPKHLRVRARPQAPGQHAWRLLFEDRLLASGAVMVGPGTAPAFVRVDPQRPRWFTTPDGHAFQPIGWNICYPTDRAYGSDLRDYLPREQTMREMFRQVDALGEAGGNCLRLWLSDWWCGLEWDENVDAYLGLGRWNLRHAWQVDQILGHARKRGLTVMITHLNHVRLADSYGWPRNPYRRLVEKSGAGGYWTEPRAATAADAVVAAGLARWADDPTVLTWDYMSESDLVSGNDWPGAKRHIFDRLAGMRARDPWGRPVSNHVCLKDDPSFAADPHLDYFSSNAYPGVGYNPFGQIAAVTSFAQRWAMLRKPVLIAEYGGHWAGSPPAQMNRDILAGLWAGIGSPLAGAPFAWWWNIISADDLGAAYRSAAAFLAADDPAAEDTPELGGWRTRQVELLSGGPVTICSVGSDRLRRVILLDDASMRRCNAEPPPCQPVVIRLSGLTPGDYQLEVWDGVATAPVTVTPLRVPAEGTATLRQDSFHGVRALRLRPAGTAVMAAPLQAPPAAPFQAPPAGTLSWRLTPLTPPAPPSLASRIMAEVVLALPTPLAGRFPRARPEGGGDEWPCAWEELDGGRAIRLRLPGNLAGPGVVTIEADAGPTWTVTPTEVGLLAESFGSTGRAYGSHQAALAAFAAGTIQGSARVDGIDQTDNPCGLNQFNTMTRYSGPLLLPAGRLEFSLNCDDGMSVTLNGLPLIKRIGPGNMEIINSPAKNLWRERVTAEPGAGFHALLALHQQGGGDQLARLGWDGPSTAPDDPLLPGGPPGTMRGIRVLPPWRCDGRIPLALTVLVDGQPAAEFRPVADLELRAPRHRLATLAVARGDAAPELRVLPRAGWQLAQVGTRELPVWGGNRYARGVTLSWRLIDAGPDSPALEATLLDATLDLTAAVAGRELGALQFTPRKARRWSLTPGDLGQAFSLRVGGQDLLRARLPPAPGHVPGLGLRVDPSWFLRGLSADELVAHVAASLSMGPLVFAADLDRSQPEVRSLLTRLTALSRDRGVRVVDEAAP